MMRRWLVYFLVATLAVSLAAVALKWSRPRITLDWETKYAGDSTQGKLSLVGDDLLVDGQTPLHAYGLDGKLRWEFTAPHPPGMTTGVAVHGDRLYVGTNSNYLYSLDKTGKVQWERKLEAVPNKWGVYVVAGRDGTVYGGIDESEFCAFATDGKPLWKRPGTQFQTDKSRATASGSQVLLATWSGISLYDRHGTYKAINAPNAAFLSTPRIIGNTVYCANAMDGIVSAIDLVSGKYIWIFKAQIDTGSRPFISSKGLTFITEENPSTVTVLNPTGKPLFKLPGGGFYTKYEEDALGRIWCEKTNLPTTSPKQISKLSQWLANRIGSNRSKLLVFDETGKLLASTKLPFDACNGIVPLPDGRMLMVGSKNRFYCFSLPK